VVIDEDLRSALRAAAAKAMGPEIDVRCLELLRDVGVFRTFVTAELGGTGADPAAAMNLIEELAGLYGALGWLSFVGVCGGMFAVELPPTGAAEVYADPDALVAYAGAEAGTLTRTAQGFLLSGRWEIVTGLSHAHWVGLGCRIAGEPDGSAVALVPADACRVAYGWNPVGLVGTGTGSATVAKVRLPEHRVVRRTGGAGRDWRSARYRFALPSLMASVSIGLVQAALRETSSLLAAEPAVAGRGRRADSDHVQRLLGRGYAEVHAAHAFLREVTAETWRCMGLGQDPGIRHAALHRLAATHAATVAAEVSSAIAGIAGTRGVTGSDVLCQRWLDARTVAANVTVRDLYYGVYGGVAACGTVPASWP